MNKIIPVIIIIGAIITGTVFFINKSKNNPPPISIEKEIIFDGKNATFTIDGKSITLVNGISEIQSAPDAASKITTRYFGNEAKGDLTGDGIDDIAFLVTQDAGGSGLFYYAVVAVKNKNSYTTTNAFFIGDRIAPQSSYIPANSQELQINYATRKPNEPMTAQPSQGATFFLRVTVDGILENAQNKTK